ncbi:cyclic nucleotide-gated ion channel 2-like [Hibiscus syriacus]|uniref:cyclic nucleotide-gated ion channel 2-like n=1 Tax=Hibiscus syriacus TaxID=106335 RepID=UPI0019246660|nr:cyclic nucleotide-gated ion channel 2-like [Hibiscus syriacus]
MDAHDELRWLKNDSRSSSERDGPLSSSVECYACTQVGLPVFHSTSCSSVYQPQWEAFAGSSLLSVESSSGPTKNLTRARSMSTAGPFGKILDPRSGLVQKWNRVLLVARGIALAVDPMFFYTLTLMVTDGGPPCVHLDGGLAAIVTLVRTCVDAVHLAHIWLQFRLAYVSKESLVIGCGKLVWDARAIASHYVRSLKGFWFDFFVILPVPQVVFWLIVPKLLREEQYKLIMAILLAMILFQFLPQVRVAIVELWPTSESVGCWWPEVSVGRVFVRVLVESKERGEGHLDLRFNIPRRARSSFGAWGGHQGSNRIPSPPYFSVSCILVTIRVKASLSPHILASIALWRVAIDELWPTSESVGCWWSEVSVGRVFVRVLVESKERGEGHLDLRFNIPRRARSSFGAWGGHQGVLVVV